jgi:hypothetical protein
MFHDENKPPVTIEACWESVWASLIESMVPDYYTKDQKERHRIFVRDIFFLGVSEFIRMDGRVASAVSKEAYCALHMGWVIETVANDSEMLTRRCSCPECVFLSEQMKEKVRLLKEVEGTSAAGGTTH